ncbi:guanine deaminase [Euryarchaeota archaeon ex4484_178]|nr:MAG: guanine deaminase [Euryarchaeota archaeon ex4484_178]
MADVYYSRLITFVDGELRDYGKVYLIVKEGRVWRISKDRPEGKVINYEDFIIVPGFVDVHTHLAQIDVRARWEPNLLRWLERYIFPTEMRFQDESYAKEKAEEFFKELLRNGTTAAAVYSSPYRKATDIAFEIASHSGLWIIMGQVLMDLNAPSELLTSAEVAEKDIKYLSSKWHGCCGRIFYAVTPRFAVSCSMEMMKRISKIASARKLYIQTHLAEQEDEVEKVQEMYNEYGRYTEVYFHASLLTSRTIVAHAIYLADEDVNILKETDTAIAHCPSSNFFLHSGKMDIFRLKSAKIRIGFGSDIAAGPYFSMLEVARDASYTNKISPVESFYYITLGGAKALGISEHTGSLEIGKYADFVVIDISSLTDLDATKEEILSSLIYRGDDRNIMATYVGGRKMFGKS